MYWSISTFRSWHFVRPLCLSNRFPYLYNDEFAAFENYFDKAPHAISLTSKNKTVFWTPLPPRSAHSNNSFLIWSSQIFLYSRILYNNIWQSYLFHHGLFTLKVTEVTEILHLICYSVFAGIKCRNDWWKSLLKYSINSRNHNL